MKCLLIGASCNDTMGRMHSDAQFAGRHSASVTTLWLLVRLTLLLRSISKRLPVKPVMTLSHARLDRASHYLKFTETSFGCLYFFVGAGVGACSYLKRSDVPKKHPKFVSSLMSGHPMSDMFQMARGVV